MISLAFLVLLAFLVPHNWCWKRKSVWTRFDFASLDQANSASLGSSLIMFALFVEQPSSQSIQKCSLDLFDSATMRFGDQMTQIGPLVHLVGQLLVRR